PADDGARRNAPLGLVLPVDGLQPKVPLADAAPLFDLRHHNLHRWTLGIIGHGAMLADRRSRSQSALGAWSLKRPDSARAIQRRRARAGTRTPTPFGTGT